MLNGRALATLPRETRDTLFLLGVIAWILLLQTPYLPPPCSALAFALLGARAWLSLRQRALPGVAWRLALLALALAATWINHQALLGQQAGATLVALLLALKTLELRARRDAFVVFFLGFFVLLTLFFHSQSLPTALGMGLGLLGLLSALVNAHLPLGRPPLALPIGLAARLLLLGTPLMLALFLLFPRVAPLWRLPSDALGGRSGLSDQMQIGQIAELALDPSLAFRVAFEGPAPPQSALYFRGPVLSRFDGRTWRPAPAEPDLGRSGLRVTGAGWRYRITLEPSHRPWLPVLEATPRAPAVPGHVVYMSPELQWLTLEPITELVRYEALSYPDFRHGPERASPELDAWRELPAGYNPRTLELARQLRREAERAAPPGPETDFALVQTVLARLRGGGYRYTLGPGSYGRDSADEFWFDRRAGFCEHIATSFVILMRALDIPARVVTGYQGGERNPIDGEWSVRQSDAHAWAEVWLPDRGWLRIDPTSAVQPDRIGASQRLQAAPGLLAGTMLELNPTLTAELRLAWEALNSRWKQSVLDYGQARQLDLLRRLGLDAPDSGDLLRLLAGLIAALGLGGTAWLLRQRLARDPWLALLQRTRERLRRAGYAVEPQATPRQLARLLASADSAPHHARLRRWLLDFERLRYDPACTLSLAALRRDWRALDWPAPSRPGRTGDPARTER